MQPPMHTQTHMHAYTHIHSTLRCMHTHSCFCRCGFVSCCCQKRKDLGSVKLLIPPPPFNSFKANKRSCNLAEEKLPTTCEGICPKAWPLLWCGDPGNTEAGMAHPVWDGWDERGGQGRGREEEREGEGEEKRLKLCNNTPSKSCRIAKSLP